MVNIVRVHSFVSIFFPFEHLFTHNLRAWRCDTLSALLGPWDRHAPPCRVQAPVHSLMPFVSFFSFDTTGYLLDHSLIFPWTRSPDYTTASDYLHRFTFEPDLLSIRHNLGRFVNGLLISFSFFLSFFLFFFHFVIRHSLRSFPMSYTTCLTSVSTFEVSPQNIYVWTCSRYLLLIMAFPFLGFWWFLFYRLLIQPSRFSVWKILCGVTVILLLYRLLL